MIEKTVYVDNSEYQLLLGTDKKPYAAELREGEDVIARTDFRSKGDISARLKKWIVSAVNTYDGDKIFRQIEEWDGVIE